MANRKYGAFTGILYPEDSRCSQALSFLSSSDGYLFYATHDKDMTDTGEIKKPHIHFVYKPVNPRTLTGLAKSMGIPSNYLEPARNMRSCVRYLIHLDTPDKYQYSPDIISTGGCACLAHTEEYLSAAPYKPSDDEMAGLLASYILSYGKGVSVSSVLSYALDSGFYSAFRRGFSVFFQLIKEVNQ